MHIDDGTLRAYYDAALNLPERNTVAEHLSGCNACRERAVQLDAQAHQIAARLALLAPQNETTDARVALARLHRRRAIQEKETNVFNPIFGRRLRPVWMGIAIVLLAVFALSLRPVQVWAGQFLSLFRVQQVVVLPIDTTGLSQLNGNEALAKQVSQMVSKSVTVTKEPGQPKQVDNAASASKLAGFSVRTPASQTDTPQFTVNGGTAFQIVVDRNKAQSLLNETGRSDLVLPASLDGAVIKADIPSSVSIGYGCPAFKPEQPGAKPTETSGSPGRRMVNCVMLVEMPSPTVDTPPDIDVKQLAEIGLEFTGMTPEQAKAYSATVDWTSTLVIPVPRNGASYKQVNVDGVTGYLIQRPVDDAPGYALVWVKDGIIYAISGMNNNADQAIQMASSLK
ncbi:MAG: DUF4367 domain-containing protein [Anaerolineae bacterium]